MAHLTGEIQFIGRIGQLTAYRRKDSDKIIVRSRGGASKKKIMKSPKFANTRRVMGEFGIRATATSHIMRAFLPLKAVADYNMAGPLNALMKPIQVLDTTSKWGKRDVSLYKLPHILDGFSLNKRNPLDSIVRTTLKFDISKEDLNGVVHFPETMPGINFFTPPNTPAYFSFEVVIGLVPEVGFGSKSGTANGLPFYSKQSEWYPVLKGSAPFSLNVEIPGWEKYKDDKQITVVLSAGICFGNPVADGQIKQMKYAGAGKILAAR